MDLTSPPTAAPLTDAELERQAARSDVCGYQDFEAPVAEAAQGLLALLPNLVDRIFDALAKLNEAGLTMLMVEQSAEMALSLAHRAVILQNGSVVMSGLAEALRSDERVHASYLGSSRG